LVRPESCGRELMGGGPWFSPDFAGDRPRTGLYDSIRNKALLRLTRSNRKQGPAGRLAGKVSGSKPLKCGGNVFMIGLCEMESCHAVTDGDEGDDVMPATLSSTL
jgi:hypothetical protein